MAQLPQTSSSENWKPRFSSMSQKSKIVFDFFPIISFLFLYIYFYMLSLHFCSLSAVFVLEFTERTYLLMYHQLMIFISLYIFVCNLWKTSINEVCFTYKFIPLWVRLTYLTYSLWYDHLFISIGTATSCKIKFFKTIAVQHMVWNRALTKIVQTCPLWLACYKMSMMFRYFCYTHLGVGVFPAHFVLLRLQ